MIKKVRKAIIPAAGLGTRFLPATKSVPKEMLPIVDRPIILFIVEEAVRAGIEDIVIVQGRHKTAIEDFFDVSYELQDKLTKDGKKDWVDSLLKIQSLANIISIRQHEAAGLGHAVQCSKPIVGDEAFAVLLGDEIMMATEQQKTVTEILVNGYNSTSLSSVAIMQVPQSEVSKYGIAEATESAPGSYKISKVIEKPAPGQTQSRWALPGRYVFDSKIYSYIENTKPGKGGEIQLTDAMSMLIQKQGLMGFEFDSKRYDAGDKFGYLQANIEVALQHPQLAEQMKVYIKSLAQKI
jgi:UTP--glucose-1-phosphate uridylyltransferase